MSSQHLIFIPSILLLGMVIGYVLGARAVRSEIARKQARLKD